MNKKSISIAALAAVLVMGLTAMAYAGPGYGRGQGGQGCGVYGQQLTPEKQAAVESIRDKYQPKFDELRTEMWTKHSTLQAMINAGNADEKKIGKLTADIAKLRDQMRDTREAMRADLEKETGLVGFGGRGRGMGYGPGQGRGMGYGPGQGRGPADCVGAGPCWN